MAADLLTAPPRRSEREGLLRAIRTVQEGAALGERAEVALGPVCAALMEALELYDTDPTLLGCPAGRERDWALLAELGLQAVALVRSAVKGYLPARWPVERRWEEVEVLAGRLPGILARARRHAQPNPDSARGARTVSRLWLEAGGHRLDDAAAIVRAVIGPSMELEHVDPRAATLALIADRLEKLSAELQAARSTTVGRWNAAEAAEVRHAGEEMRRVRGPECVAG